MSVALSLPYWFGQTSPAQKTSLAQFLEICNCTISYIQSGTLALRLRFIPSGTSGKMERAPLQAARKVVTVVVVEDDWMIRENMVTDLRQEGWAVLEAATGAGALKAEKVDLLITDIGLADALGRRRSIPKPRTPRCR